MGVGDLDVYDGKLSSDLELSVVEQFVLTSFRLSLMAADLEAETSDTRRELKRRDRDAEVLRAMELVRVPSIDEPQWVFDFRRSTDPNSREGVNAAFCSAVDAFGATITSRARSLMLLIDTVIFNPWSGGAEWRTRDHHNQLARVAGALSSLDSHDLNMVQREYETSLRRLRRTSAELGEGVSAVLERLPDSVGGGLKSAALWMKSFDTDVVDTALRAEVMTRLVVIQAEHDEEKAKRVVQSIQERLAAVAVKQEELGAKIRELRNVNMLLSSENRELRRQLQEERQRAQLAESALQAALDHIFDPPIALTSGSDEQEVR